MTHKYHHCPTCGKKGVYLKLQHGEDGYLCRYCQWGVFLDPESDAEKRVLADLEISIRMSRYRNLNEAYDGGWNAHAEHARGIRTAAEAVIEHFYSYKNCECGVPISLHGNLTSCSLSSNGSAELSALKGALEGKI